MVHLFKPRNKSGILAFQSWIQQSPAEFKNPGFVCESEGREGELRKLDDMENLVSVAGTIFLGI
jgi:hypothetical protein